MKLYTHEMAPNPLRVNIFVREKNIKLETVELEFMEGELKTDEFSARNPMQRIPVLELADGTYISESHAICRYLEQMYPLHPLMGLLAKEQALIEMWNRRAEFNILGPAQHCLRHTSLAMAKLEVPQIEQWGEANRQRALEALNVFDSQLAQNEFVAGDRFTIADITTYVAVNFLKPSKIPVPEKLENLNKWFQRVKKRESISTKRTLAA
ncbi:glutathione S-transferase family protein [Flexibacterium corallicola]|uniref:glutathione S-transferase family protein n=1 Tax=Flexibacterium corallicola TaxID=3037259 RepID=UPI00286F03E7|nr:glutathione S-transferase [Pseudovibrio sp. M1P-2-3]